MNQSIAAARASAHVVHVCDVGSDGGFLIDLLRNSGVCVEALCHIKVASGHAIIQVTSEEQNAIIVYGGANQQL